MCTKKISFEKEKKKRKKISFTSALWDIITHTASSTPFILSLADFSTNPKYLERHVIRIIVERISTSYYRAM